MSPNCCIPVNPANVRNTFTYESTDFGKSVATTIAYKSNVSPVNVAKITKSKLTNFPIKVTYDVTYKWQFIEPACRAVVMCTLAFVTEAVRVFPQLRRHVAGLVYSSISHPLSKSVLK
jgi:hypothetical protein